MLRSVDTYKTIIIKIVLCHTHLRVHFDIKSRARLALENKIGILLFSELSCEIYSIYGSILLVECSLLLPGMRTNPK